METWAIIILLNLYSVEYAITGNEINIVERFLGVMHSVVSLIFKWRLHAVETCQINFAGMY